MLSMYRCYIDLVCGLLCLQWKIFAHLRFNVRLVNTEASHNVAWFDSFQRYCHCLSCGIKLNGGTTSGFRDATHTAKPNSTNCGDICACVGMQLGESFLDNKLVVLHDALNHFKTNLNGKKQINRRSICTIREQPCFYNFHFFIRWQILRISSDVMTMSWTNSLPYHILEWVLFYYIVRSGRTEPLSIEQVGIEQVYLIANFR